MIYLSTGYMKKNSEILFKKFKKFRINNIEFSSGIYEKNKVQSILKKKNLFNLTIHNYFPPPKKPFTMNLGSLNDQIYSETYKLIKKNIDYSSKIGSQFYSFHAGFLIDPLPRELGKKIVSKKINNEAKVEKKFLFGLKKLSNYAQKKNVKLLIENNVLTKKNLINFGQNPLLMVDINQTLRLAKKFPKNVKILLDVGHLKVSSKTLEFSAYDYLSKCSNYISGYHLSENNGLEDENKPIKKNSWFLPYLNKNLDYYTLEIKSMNFKKLKSQLELLKKILK